MVERLAQWHTRRLGYLIAAAVDFTSGGCCSTVLQPIWLRRGIRSEADLHPIHSEFNFAKRSGFGGVDCMLCSLAAASSRLSPGNLLRNAYGESSFDFIRFFFRISLAFFPLFCFFALLSHKSFASGLACVYRQTWRGWKIDFSPLLYTIHFICVLKMFNTFEKLHVVAEDFDGERRRKKSFIESLLKPLRCSFA